MKYFIPITLLLLCLPWLGYAQMQVLSSSSKAIGASIDLAAGQLTLGPTSSSTSPKVSNIQLTIDKGDIVISYQLANLEEDHFFEIVPVIKLDDRRLILSTDEFRGDLGRPIAPGSRSITWLNPLERYINLVGQLEVTIEANEWGEPELPYDCTLGKPTFTGKQKLPYLLAAGVGAASIGVGQLFKKQSEDKYEEYLQSETLAEASPIYKDANSKNQMYLILTWAGSGILAADAILYLIRQGKYKRDLKNYETYCQSNTIGFQPVLELPNGSTRPNGHVGLKVTVPITGRR